MRRTPARLLCLFATATGLLSLTAAASLRAETAKAEATDTPRDAAPAPDAAQRGGAAGSSSRLREKPVPARPIAPTPVRPTTVVTPTAPQQEGVARAASAPAPARRASAAATPVAPRPAPLSLGEHGAIELGRAGQRESHWHGFLISLSLRDAPLPEVLRSFAKIAGVNLVLDPRVQGTVTVELHDVPWDEALHVILESQGMGAEIDGRIWLVSPY